MKITMLDRFISEVINGERKDPITVELVREYFADAFRDVDLTADETVGDLAWIVRFVTELRTASPDICFHLDFGSDDEAGRSWRYYTATGTWSGPLYGKKPNFKTFRVPEIHIATFAPDGRVKRHWGSGADREKMQFVGLLPMDLSLLPDPEWFEEQSRLRGA